MAITLPHTFQNNTIPESERPLPTYKRIGPLEERLIPEFRGEYGRILVIVSNLVKQAMHLCETDSDRQDFIREARNGYGFYGDAFFAMLNGEDYKPAIWQLVQQNLADVFAHVFSGPDEPCQSVGAEPFGDFEESDAWAVPAHLPEELR